MRIECRPIETSDYPLITTWTRQLQVDEGVSPMDPEEIASRLQRWLRDAYEAVIFECESEPIGYALYRPTDPDMKEPGGVYLRQFFISREKRRRGYGTRAFRSLVSEIVRGRRLVLEVLTSNPIGEGFWQSLGMRVYSQTLELRNDLAHESTEV